jgi:hypothetical protein
MHARPIDAAHVERNTFSRDDCVRRMSSPSRVSDMVEFNG